MYITLKLEHFWKRWQAEYLVGLREFHKCSSGGNVRTIQKGDVVIVYGEGEKRCNWKLAVVEELIKGRDGVIRGAKVKVARKMNIGKPIYLNRPLQKLYPLEVQARLGGNGEDKVHNPTELGGPRKHAKRAAAVASEVKTKTMLTHK